jgi:protein TonB
MRCIHCGNDVRPGDASCRHCGARIVRPSMEESSSRSSSGKVLGFFLLLLIAGAAAWFGNADRAAIWSNQIQEVFRATTAEPPPPVPAPPVTVPSAPATAPAVAAPTPAAPAATAPPAAEPAGAPAVTPGPASTDRRRAAATKKEAPAPRAAEPTPQAPPRAAESNTSQPVRAGGNIPTPTKIKDVRPVYPPQAIQARIQGVVIIEATIGKDGAVERARVLRSIPLLDPAALDAVRQWRFTPTTLNGEPVPVIMTVTVQFALQ